MFSEKDFERLWFLYKTESGLKVVSINSFCKPPIENLLMIDFDGFRHNFLG